MSASIYLATVCLPLATVIIVFAMRYVSNVQQARARLANDEAYRQMAEKAVATQSETANALSSIQAALTDARDRLASVERILRDVE